uniref:Efflux transporter, RND family, MFP subunit n=1 Tax=Solibacter usitatus (strain Ellin6076) TaxID=234267 RepID=Q01R55_SOLUE
MPGHRLAQPPPSPPRKMHRAWTWLLLPLAIGLFFVVQRYKGNRPPNASRLIMPGAVAITTATAKKGTIGVYLESIGTVTPVYTSSITAQVNGLVTAVHYAEGQMVHKGDALIDIDPRPFQAQVLQAQGTLDRDTNLLAQAKMDLDRYRAAWARNAIPKQQLDDQEKLVLQDEGQVKSDQGNLQFFQVQLGWCHITAPFTGRIGLRPVDPGNVVVLTAGNQVNATTSLAVITQTQPITVVFTLAQDNLGEVRSQFRRRGTLPVAAYDRALQTRIASGSLTALDNQVDTTTGTVKLRATFENGDDALFPNQFVNTRLLVTTLKGVTLVPGNVIQHNGQVTFVYVISDGVAHMQTVKVGTNEGGMTQVEGIAPGTVVAASSFERLQDNVPVTVVRTPMPGATGGADTR